MANAVVSNQGQINGAGATDATFLKVYSGELLATFQKASKFLDKHTIRSIEFGKSATFPVVGQNSASYHTAGTEILGNAVLQTEKVIAIDDLLISSAFTASIEDAKNHYDFRSQMVEEAAYALSDKFDQNVAQVGVLAARASASIPGVTFGGTVLTQATFSTDSAVLAAGIFNAAQALDEKNVPADGRFCFLRPKEYNLLAQNVTVINQFYGGAGMISEGTVLKFAGITIVKTNNLPSTNITTGPAAYQGNFSTTVGLVMHPKAVGTVKLMDLATEMNYDFRRLGHLVVSKYAMGHGILRPECSVELKTA